MHRATKLGPTSPQICKSAGLSDTKIFLTGVYEDVILFGFAFTEELLVTKQLSRLTLALHTDTPIDRARAARLGPHLQGVLMETVSTNYAQALHESKVNPYSQCALGRSDNLLDWQISTLTNDAARHILEPLAQEGFSEFRVRSAGLSITVTGRTLETTQLSELSRIFHAPPQTNRFRVNFLTPTAFKQAGEYVFWPDPRLVFQSLAQKYCAIVDDEEPEEGLIGEFGRAIRLTSYRVMSQQFTVGMVHIPGFTGSATFIVRGADPFTSFVALLLRFGEFSGCGIKSSLGMGSIQVRPLVQPRKGPSQ